MREIRTSGSMRGGGLWSPPTLPAPFTHPIPTISPSISTTYTALLPKPLSLRAIIEGDAIFPLIRHFCCALLRISPNPLLTPLFATPPTPRLPHRRNKSALIRNSYPLIRNTYTTDFTALNHL